MEGGPAHERWAGCSCLISRETGTASEPLRAGQEEVRLRGDRPDTMVEARRLDVEPLALPSRSRGDLQQPISSSFMTISCRHPLSSNSHRFTSIKEKHLMSSIFRRQPLFALARIMHEPPAATAAMAVLPGVLGCRTLRRTEEYASGPSPCGCPVARPSPRSRHGVLCAMRASSRNGEPGGGHTSDGFRGPWHDHCSRDCHWKDHRISGNLRQKCPLPRTGANRYDGVPERDGGKE